MFKISLTIGIRNSSQIKFKKYTILNVYSSEVNYCICKCLKFKNLKKDNLDYFNRKKSNKFFL